MDLVAARFRDVPVLAEKTSHVAPRGAHAEHAGSRKKMIQRFFLNGIDLQSRRRAVTQVVKFSVLIDPNEAEASLTRTNMAMAGTEEAPDAAVNLPPPTTAVRRPLAFFGVVCFFRGSSSIVSYILSPQPS